jgi:hypothetical protein
MNFLCKVEAKGSAKNVPFSHLTKPPSAVWRPGPEFPFPVRDGYWRAAFFCIPQARIVTLGRR